MSINIQQALRKCASLINHPPQSYVDDLPTRPLATEPLPQRQHVPNKSRIVRTSQEWKLMNKFRHQHSTTLRKRQFLLLHLPLFLLLLTLPLVVIVNQQKEQNIHKAEAATGNFTISVNKIYDPWGNRFYVRGATAVWGRFIGPTYGIGQTNYNSAQADFVKLKSLGVNLIRLFVSGYYYQGIATTDPSYNPNYLQEVDNVITWANQQGMVVQLINSKTTDATINDQFLALLAARYKANPYVWITPQNEPNCEWGDTTKCYDWTYWQNQENHWIQVIRSNGNAQPIIVNGIDWSGDFSKIDNYKLSDPAVILGVHRYHDNNPPGWTQQNVTDNQTWWANYLPEYPIIIDENGVTDGTGTEDDAWSQVFLDYVTNLVNTQNMAGYTGYVWYATDGNQMTDGQENLNFWGNMINNHYYTKVPVTLLPPYPNGTPLPTATPTPETSGTATPTPGTCSGLKITTPLALDQTTIALGGTIHGTVTYTNTCTGTYTISGAVIAARTSTGGNADFANGLLTTTFQPGQSITINGSRTIATTDPTGQWYAFASYEDTSSTWHADSNKVYFTVVAPTPTPVPDTILPTVVITSPQNGATIKPASTITISASASDNVGVSRVDFLVNGTLVCSAPVSPYTCSWTVPGTNNITYTITAQAYDAMGNAASQSIMVTASKKKVTTHVPKRPVKVDHGRQQ